MTFSIGELLDLDTINAAFSGVVAGDGGAGVSAAAAAASAAAASASSSSASTSATAAATYQAAATVSASAAAASAASAAAATATIAAATTAATAATAAAAAAQSSASTAISAVAAEVTRAEGAEGTLTTSIASLTTTVGGNTSAISSEALTRATADSALSASITTLTSDYSSLSSTVSANYATLSTANSTTATAVTLLKSQVLPSQNQIVNSTGAQGMTGWTEYDNYTMGGSSGAWYAGTNPYFGYWISKALTGAAAVPTGVYVTLIGPQFSIVGGQQYTFSGYLWSQGMSPAVSGADTRGFVVSVQFYNASHTYVGEVDLIFSPTNTTGYYTTTVTVPATATYGFADVFLTPGTTFSATNAGVGFYNLMFEMGAVATVWNDGATVGSISASVTSEAVTRAAADSSLAASITTLNTNYGTLSSTVSSNYTTLSSANSTNAANISSVSSTVGGLSSTVTGLSATSATLTGQVYGTYALTLNSNGNIAGMTLYSSGGGSHSSLVAFEASLFTIKSATSSTITPFTYDSGSGTLFLNSITVNTANIASLSVGTLQLANNAATNPNGVFTSSASLPSSGVQTTITSITITTSGGPVQVLANTQLNNSPTGSGGTVYLYRGSTLLLSMPYYVYAQKQVFPFIYYDSGLSAGTYTYSLQGVSTGGSAVTASSANIIPIEFKK